MRLAATILNSTMLGGVEIYGVGQVHLRWPGNRCWCGGEVLGSPGYGFCGGEHMEGGGRKGVIQSSRMCQKDVAGEMVLKLTCT